MNSYKIHHATKKLIIVETPPSIRTINFENEAYYRLSVPYMIFVLMMKKKKDGERKLDELFLYFSHKPLKSLKDTKLRECLLPNMDGVAVCRGKKAPSKFSKNKTADEIVQKVIGDFWSSVFTDDLGMAHGIKGWARATENNPEYWRELKSLSEPLEKSLHDFFIKKSCKEIFYPFECPFECWF